MTVVPGWIIDKACDRGKISAFVEDGLESVGLPLYMLSCSLVSLLIVTAADPVSPLLFSDPSDQICVSVFIVGAIS